MDEYEKGLTVNNNNNSQDDDEIIKLRKTLKKQAEKKLKWRYKKI